MHSPQGLSGIKMQQHPGRQASVNRSCTRSTELTREPRNPPGTTASAGTLHQLRAHIAIVILPRFWNRDKNVFPMTLKHHQCSLQALPYPSSAGFPLDFPRSLGCFQTHFLATPGWKTYEQQILQHCFLTTNVTFRHDYSHSLCSEVLQSLPS